MPKSVHASPWDLIGDVADRMGMFIVRTEENVENTSYRDKMESQFKKTGGKIEAINTFVDTFEGLYTVLQPIGIVLLILNLCALIGRESQKNGLNEQFWMKIMLTTSMSILVIANIDMIFDTITSVADILYKYLSNELIKDGGIMDKALANRTELAVQSWDKKSVIDKFMLGIDTMKDMANHIVQMGALNIASILVNCALDTVIFALGIRMVLRRMFAPIAVASISLDGMKGPGMRYLKRYAAYYIQEAIILLASVIYVIMSAVVSQTTAAQGLEALNPLDFLSQIWVQVALKAALVTVVTGSHELAREIIAE